MSTPLKRQPSRSNLMPSIKVAQPKSNKKLFKYALAFGVVYALCSILDRVKVSSLYD